LDCIRILIASPNLPHPHLSKCQVSLQHTWQVSPISKTPGEGLTGANANENWEALCPLEDCVGLRVCQASC
jgi:hypothetical protein